MIVEATELCVRRQGRYILQGVDLSVRAGELIALTGHNGAGKSTLLRSLNGLVRASSGEIRLMGKPIATLSLREIARIAAYMPQQTAEAGDTTVVECVLAGRLPHMSGSGQRDRQITFATLERLGLLDFAPRRLSQLSGGERQRVLLARAMVQEPALLLLDEPTSALDLRYQLEAFEQMTAIVAGGTGVIVAIHDLGLAMRYADRVVMLGEGRLLANGPPSMVTSKLIASAYGVEARIARIDRHSVVVPVRSSRIELDQQPEWASRSPEAPAIAPIQSASGAARQRPR